MKRRSFRYKNLFTYGSLQFCGNIEQYFSEHCERCVVFIVLPRTDTQAHLLRVYSRGVLKEERKIRLSEHVLFYYLLWYLYYVEALVRYFQPNETVIVLSQHPISFIGMTILKYFRKLRFVFWVCDYFPPVSRLLRVYERLKKHYHDVIPYACYLSDRINEKMNGTLVVSDVRKTVMWGVRSRAGIPRRTPRSGILRLCFVGVLRNSQGVSSLIDFIRYTPGVSLSILGWCEPELYNEYRQGIERYGLSQRIFFPNRSYYESDLEREIKKCSIGMALYDTGVETVTYYADPAKVKLYTELGLPVIMTRSAEIASYIERFHAGEIVRQNIPSIAKAVRTIRKNYATYKSGVNAFNRYFQFESYYRQKFRFLEDIV